MKLHQEFTMARPIEEVWAFFHDVPRVAACLPGAEYLGAGENGRHLGKVSARLGPFQASFEGEAELRYDDARKSVVLDGKGVDRKGASRGKMAMTCTLQPIGAVTAVVVDSDVQLSGSIAQFGRTGLITEMANVLISDFVSNAEAALQAPQPAAPRASAARPLGGFALALAALRGWFKSRFSRTP
jgi:carbon monoxide dehydrogenase subunit G